MNTAGQAGDLQRVTAETDGLHLAAHSSASGVGYQRKAPVHEQPAQHLACVIDLLPRGCRLPAAASAAARSSITRRTPVYGSAMLRGPIKAEEVLQRDAGDCRNPLRFKSCRSPLKPI